MECENAPFLCISSSVTTDYLLNNARWQTTIPSIDYDIKMNTDTICKHMCRTRIGPQRCCHSTVSEIEWTGGFFVRWTNWKQRKEKKITSGQSENVLGFWTKNCPQKTTQKQLHMEFLKFKTEKGWNTQSLPPLPWYSMERSALRPPKFLTYINSRDQKDCQMYWGSQPLLMQELPSITFERLQT